MFRPGERACVSVNQFSSHSIPLDNILGDKVTLVSPNDKVLNKTVSTDDLVLVALNPMKSGFRLDENASSFRNFLVEMDYGSIPEQMAYIKKMGLPYSAVVFSGNKSLHFLLSLDTDLPSEGVYRKFSEWILNIITLADQNTKNPSRSIRIPGAKRDTGKYQELIEFNGPVKLETLTDWLKKHPDAKPKEKQRRTVSDKPNFDLIKPWVSRVLVEGITSKRNARWYAVSYEFFLTGHDLDSTIEILGAYFSPDPDFKEREWEATIKSAYKAVYERKRDG